MATHRITRNQVSDLVSKEGAGERSDRSKLLSQAKTPEGLTLSDGSILIFRQETRKYDHITAHDEDAEDVSATVTKAAKASKEKPPKTPKQVKTTPLPSADEFDPAIEVGDPVGDPTDTDDPNMDPGQVALPGEINTEGPNLTDLVEALTQGVDPLPDVPPITLEDVGEVTLPE